MNNIRRKIFIISIILIIFIDSSYANATICYENVTKNKQITLCFENNGFFFGAAADNDGGGDFDGKWRRLKNKIELRFISNNLVYLKLQCRYSKFYKKIIMSNCDFEGTWNLIRLKIKEDK